MKSYGIYKGKFKSFITLVLVFALLFTLPVSFDVSKVFASSAAEGENIRAIIYDKYELVFQNESSELDLTRNVTYDSFGIGDGTGIKKDISNLINSLSENVTILDDTYHNLIPWYIYRDNITKVIFKDRIKPVSTACWFYWLKNMTTVINTENLDTSAVTCMAEMFRACKKLKSIDVSSWDVSEVTHMNYMFYECFVLESLSVDNWNVSSLINGNGLFSNCNKLSLINVSNWNVSKLKYAKSMFNSVGASEIPFEDWNVENLIDVESFLDSSSIVNVDISKWNPKKIQSLYCTFKECKSLESVNFGTSMTFPECVNFIAAFSECSSLKNIDFSGCTFSKNITSVKKIFYNCASLESADISTLNLSGAADVTTAFYNNSSLKKIILGNAWRAGSGTLEYENWKNLDTKEILSQDKLIGSYQPSYAGTWCVSSDIVFYGNNGTPYAQSIEGFLGDPLIFDFTATRKGYDFAGWFTEKDGGTELESGESPTQYSYYAHWDEHTYDLILHGNGGTPDSSAAAAAGGAVIEYNGESVIKFTDLKYTDFLALNASLFTKSGDDNILARWNTRQNGTGTDYDAAEEISRLTEENNGTAHLYAQWHEPIATVNYHYQFGEPETVETRQYVVSTKFELFEPERTGHTLIGWYTEKDGKGTKVTEDSVVNNDYNIYAYWQKNPVIILDGNGGYFNSDSTQTTYTKQIRYGAALGYLPVPDHGSATLKGWFTAQTGGDEKTSKSVLTKDTTLYAQWGYRPVIDSDGGIITSSVEYAIQDDASYKVSSLPEVKREGYTFSGWYHGDTKVEEGNTIDLSSDSTIKARWTAVPVLKVTLDPNGGTVSQSSINVYSGSAINQLPVPVKSGYEFQGWYGASDFSGDKYTASSVISSNITLYAKWAEKNITLTFNPGEGTMYGSEAAGKTYTETLVSGNTLNELPAASRTDYVLEGWYTDISDENTKLTTSQVINQNATYHAKWAELKQTEGGNYKYYIRWTNASDGNVTNTGDNLSFHPYSSGDISAHLGLYFETYNTTDSVAKGTVYFRIPKYVFTDKNGSGIAACDMSGLPEYDNPNDTVYFGYYEDPADSNYYIIKNNRDLVESTTSVIELSYTVDPFYLEGGAIDGDGNYVSGYEYFKNSVNTKLSIGDTEITKKLSLEAHTKVDTQAAKTADTTVLYSWDEEWGDEPEDSDKYFYVKWNLTDTIYPTTNQKYKLTWSEDTVHDGTVVYIGNSDTWYSTSNTAVKTYAVTQHQLSDVGEDNWISVYNEAIVTETWDSGYTTSQRVSNSAYLNIQKSGGEARSFGKIIKGATDQSKHYVAGGQEDILDDEESIILPYVLNYNEVRNDSYNLKWNSTSDTYSAPHRDIVVTDGATGDIMISNTEDSNKYTWDAESVALSGSDYYFKNIKVTITEYDSYYYNGEWMEPTVNTDTDTYADFEIWISTKTNSEYVKYKTLDGNNTAILTLPEGTTGFKVKHGSDFYCTSVKVETDLVLLPSNKVTQLVEEDVTEGYNTVIKNKAVCEVTQDENTVSLDLSEKDAWLSIYELNISSTDLYCAKICGSQSSVVNDFTSGTEISPVLISGWNSNNSSRSKKMEQCVFYDLIPVGITVNPDTLYILPRTSAKTSAQGKTADQYDTYSSDSTILDKAYYDVSLTENYKNSGQIMMTVTISVPDDFTVNDKTVTGFDVFYKMISSYENIYAHGTEQDNCTAFVNNTQAQGKPNTTYGSISAIPEESRTYYSSLESENKGRIAYAHATTHEIVPTAYSWAFKNTVRTAQTYSSNETVGVNKSYTYKITYDQTDSVVTENLVFYNILEKGTSSFTSEWQGTFNGIDVNEIENVVSANVDDSDTNVYYCAPVIYYSTVSRDILDDTYFSLDAEYEGSSVWTTVKPTDSKITAVAIDCSKNTGGKDMRISGNKHFNWFISMTSPSGEGIPNDAVTADSATFKAENAAGEEIINTAYSFVTLHQVTPKISKTSMPISGTAEDPEGVVYNSVLTYNLEITNPDENMSVEGITVSDPIPQGLVLNNAVIIKFAEDGAEMGLTKSARISSYSISGSGLEFTISSLSAGETAYITIPVTVSVNSGTFTNTAEITHVNWNSLETSLKSETTYHQVKAIQAKIYKVTSSGKALSGAELEIYEGNTIDNGESPLKTLTSTSEVIEFDEWSTGKPVTAGTYVLHEKTAPTGYSTAADIVFTIDSEGLIYVNDEQVSYVEMIDAPNWSVRYHENQPEHDDAIFKIYEPKDLNANKTITHFYDIPDWAGDEYVFAGWYHNNDYSECDTPDTDADTASNFENDAYNERDTDYHLYAKWIKVGTVAKSDEDTNIISGYRGFGLAGVQIREPQMYDDNYTEITPGGLRFITSLSEDLLSSIDALSKTQVSTPEGKVDVEYGYAVGTEANINTFIDHYKVADTTAYTLQYKGINVNGKDTTQKESNPDTDYRYITNVNCTKGTGKIAKDHRNFTNYRLYTLVVTYEGDSASKKADKIDARSYIRYYDANGKLRVFFNTYKHNMYYGGCMCSYNQVSSMALPSNKAETEENP